MPRHTKGPTTPELLSDMCSLLSAMLYCMTCPDCDGSGRMPSGNRRDGTERSERCECREEAQRLLADMADDEPGDDDDAGEDDAI